MFLPKNIFKLIFENRAGSPGKSANPPPIYKKGRRVRFSKPTAALQILV